MSTGILAEYEPPQEIVALGEPERAFARSRSATEWLWGAVRGFGFLLVVVSTLIVGLFFLVAPPEVRAATGSTAVACGLCGFFFVAGAVLILAPAKPWPAFAYAFYPESLAFLQEGTWSVVRWDDVERWREPSLKSFWPALVLRDGREVALRNDYVFPARLYAEVKEALRVAEVARITGVRPVGTRSQASLCPGVDPELELDLDLDAAASRREVLRGQKRLAAGLVVVGLAMLLFNARWIVAAVRGPVPITTEQLAGAADPSALPSPWVSIEFDEVRETDLRIVSVQSGQREGTAKSRYLLARARNRWIIASVPVDHSARRLDGYLGAWWTPFSKNAVRIIETTRMPAGAASLLPYQFDAAYEVRSQCAALVAIAAFCLAGGLFLLFSR